MPLSAAAYAAHIDFAFRMAPDGVTIVYGTQKGFGLLNKPNFDVTTQQQLRIKGPKYELALRDSAFTGLTQDTSILVNSATYTIRDIGEVDTAGVRRMIVTKG